MVDLDELARRAVAAPPVQPSSVAALEQRVRQRRRRRRLAGSVPLLVLAATLVIGVPRLVGDDNGDAPVVAGEPDQDPSPPGWSVRQATGISVAVPAGWVFTDEDLTPVVSQPRTVWAVGTDPIAGYDGEPCAHQPTAALDRLAPDGALVVLFERSSAVPYDPDRDDPLWAMRGDPNQNDAQQCSSGDFDSWWFGFNEESRGFYMLVAVGPEVGHRICDVERLVNSVMVADRGGEFDRGSANTSTSVVGAPCTDPRNPLWDLPLGHDHLGPVQIGMTVEQAADVLGEDVVEKETGSGCALYRPISTPDSIEFRVDGGQIVTIQAEGVTSEAGIAVGDTEEAINEAYADKSVVDVSLPTVRRALVRPAPNSPHATVFILESGGTVARMRAGTYPAVEQYEKGCP